MVSRLRVARQLARYFGPGWLAYRAGYALRRRTGLMRRQVPAYAWADRPLSAWLGGDVPPEPEAYCAWRREHGGRFFFQGASALPPEPPWDGEAAVREAEAILAGRWRYFEHTVRQVGFPPDWHANPLSGQRAPADRHWTEIGDFGYGDIKLIWEASRFGVGYALARAYAAQRDERYPAAFWHLVEHWAGHNPPQRGPNWKCGQEATFRVMAWCFALYAFADSPESTPQRVAALAAMIAAHGERIAANIAFAQSQKNNHGISEAVGLWTIGLLFPEFKESARWRELGRRALLREMERQVYPDGAYVQHSANYHRLMLHDCLWALRLGELNGDDLPPAVRERFAAAAGFLYGLLDVESGGVPLCGASDGALVLPLNTCDYLDYRPVIQASHYLVHGERLFSPGPWDEDLWWLFGPEALGAASGPAETDSAPPELSAAAGGYYTLRAPRSWALIRCAPLQDRPADADQLHVDLWWRGQNIAGDAGTYLYNGALPWNNALVTTAVHNTVTVDGQDQMTRAGRFLWLDWSRGVARRRARSANGHLACWEGEHDGYRRLAAAVQHRRAVLRLGDEHWLVADALESAGEHEYRLHWLLPDLPCAEGADGLTLQTAAGPYRIAAGCVDGEAVRSLVRGDEASIRGWRSPYYSHKEPALSLALLARGRAVRFWSLLGPPPLALAARQGSLHVQGPGWEARIEWEGAAPLLRSVQMSGALDDALRFE
jgi:asparagine synthase (glutamine-hydrolysing)